MAHWHLLHTGAPPEPKPISAVCREARAAARLPAFLQSQRLVVIRPVLNRFTESRITPSFRAEAFSASSPESVSPHRPHFGKAKLPEAS